jgi:hypothetical protein
MRKRSGFYHVDSAYRAGNLYKEFLVREHGAIAFKKKTLPVRRANFLKKLNTPSTPKMS